MGEFEAETEKSRAEIVSSLRDVAAQLDGGDVTFESRTQGA